MFRAVNRNHRAKLAIVIQLTSGAREVAGTGNASDPYIGAVCSSTSFSRLGGASPPLSGWKGKRNQ